MASEGRENRLGLVSNCWKTQLDAGESLPELIRQATSCGFRFIELRQGCLGEFEDRETRLPLVESLASLAAEFPDVTFDLAVELPVFSEPVDPDAPAVAVLLEAARALAGSQKSAHLRIVDLVSEYVPSGTADDSFESIEFTQHDVMNSLAALQNRLPLGVVSLEHSFQPWNGFCRLFEAACRGPAGGPSVASLRLCYDPCNLWLSGDGARMDSVVGTLDVDWLSMVHLKQRVDGTVSSRLERGDVDWEQQLLALNRAGYAGPLLLETAPAGNVWNCLEDSVACLDDLLDRISN